MRAPVSSLVIGVLLLLAACTAEPTPAPSATPTQTSPGSLAAPPSGFVAFQSKTLPYRACYPEGWQVREDWVTVGSGAGDAFIGGIPGALPDVASIVAEPAEGYDTTAYLEVVLANLRAAGLGVERVGATRVNGVEAQQVRFPRLTASGERYSVQEIVWAHDGRGWVAAISSPPANEAVMAATIATMTGCFRFSN
jgi:hypothetical protein